MKLLLSELLHDPKLPEILPSAASLKLFRGNVPLDQVRVLGLGEIHEHPENSRDINNYLMRNLKPTDIVLVEGVVKGGIVDMEKYATTRGLAEIGATFAGWEDEGAWQRASDFLTRSFAFVKDIFKPKSEAELSDIAEMEKRRNDVLIYDRNNLGLLPAISESIEKHSRVYIISGKSHFVEHPQLITELRNYPYAIYCGTYWSIKA